MLVGVLAIASTISLLWPFLPNFRSMIAPGQAVTASQDDPASQGWVDNGVDVTNAVDPPLEPPRNLVVS